MTKLNYEEMLVVIRPDSPAMLSSCAYFKTTCSLALTCVAATALEVVTVTLKLLSSLNAAEPITRRVSAERPKLYLYL